jgi:hypothetical protein
MKEKGKRVGLVPGLSSVYYFSMAGMRGQRA